MVSIAQCTVDPNTTDLNMLSAYFACHVLRKNVEDDMDRGIRWWESKGYNKYTSHMGALTQYATDLNAIFDGMHALSNEPLSPADTETLWHLSKEMSESIGSIGQPSAQVAEGLCRVALVYVLGIRERGVSW
jgi:hypothetical protein